MMEATICYASLQLALAPRQDRGSRQRGAGWLRRAPWPHSGCRLLYSLGFLLIQLERHSVGTSFGWNIADAVMNCHFGEQFSESALLRRVQAAKETRVIRIRNGGEDWEI